MPTPPARQRREAANERRAANRAAFATGLRWSGLEPIPRPEPPREPKAERAPAPVAPPALPPAQWTPVDAASTRELAGKLADHGLRVLERMMHDRDPRVALEAVRALAAYVRDAEVLPAAVPATAEEKDAAIRETLESAEFCALLIRVVAVDGAAARAALLEAGWSAPED